MNQYAKEIKEELEQMCKKYHITKGILMFEEIDQKDTKLERYRTIIFAPDLKKFDPWEFATLFTRCINVSKTFQSIIQQANLQGVLELIKRAELEKKPPLTKTRN